MEKIAAIPEGVTIDVSVQKVSVSGGNGNLERDFFTPLFSRDLNFVVDNGVFKVSTESEKRKVKSYVGTVAAHVRNMVRGVTDGFVYKLKIVFVHFPMSVKVEGNEIVVSNFLGGKQIRKANIIGDTKVEIKDDEVTVSGMNREEAGQTAANIERSTKIKSRDRRIFQDGIFISEKP